MRIPDGGYEGHGYESRGFQSLHKFRGQEIGSIQTVDFRNVYKSWAELVSVLELITENEFLKINPHNSVTINFLEPDLEINPKEHNDHINTFYLIKHTKLFMTSQRRSFCSYSTFYKSSDLSNNELIWKIGVFGAYQETMLDKVGHSTFNESDDFYVWVKKSSLYRVYIL